MDVRKLNVLFFAAGTSSPLSLGSKLAAGRLVILGLATLAVSGPTPAGVMAAVLQEVEVQAKSTAIAKPLDQAASPNAATAPVLLGRGESPTTAGHAAESFGQVQRTLSEPLLRVASSAATAAGVSGAGSVSTNGGPAESLVGLVSVDKRSGMNVDFLKPTLPTTASHPLDPALELAFQKLTYLRQSIHDYKAIMIKQERIDGTLMPAEYMSIKVRNRRKLAENRQPFSIYMRFLRPTNAEGREVIYVENQNDGNLVAHECGFLNVMRVNLDPQGSMAMRGNRYPITDAGIENLVEKLIERGERDRAHGFCDVEFFENAKVLDRTCTMIQVKHDEDRAPFDFHIGRIYIDDEHQVPIRYEAYTWPKPGEKTLPLLESYTYANLEVNVGLTDQDFDPDNGEYDFP